MFGECSTFPAYRNGMARSTVGANIAKIRKRNNLTQHQLAAAANVSRSMLAQVETGKERGSTVWVGSVARALGVDPSELYGKDREPAELAEVVPVLRRALATTDFVDDVTPVELPELARQVAQVSAWRRDAQYSRITETLPDLVDALLVSGQHGTQPAYALLVDAYRAANTVAHKLGYSDLSTTATDRMVWAAEQSGDPLLLGTVHYVQAATFSRVGATPKALRLIGRSLGEIEPLVDEDATAAAVASMLHMRAGTIAAATGDADTSRAHLDEAEHLARHIGDRVVYNTPVGPANVSLYRVCAEADLGEPGRAIEYVQATRMPDGFPAERRAYFWVDAARAYLAAGQLEAATGALVESRAASAEHFRASRVVDDTIDTLAALQRRPSDMLRSLARSAGMGSLTP